MPEPMPQQGAFSSATRYGCPLAWHLGLLCAALLLPMIFLEVFLLVQLSTVERALHETGAREAARRIALVLDRELMLLEGTLELLATSDHLQRDDLAAFYQRSLVVPRLTGAAVLLRDRDGRRLSDTRVPWDTPPTAADPQDNDPEADRVAIETGRPQISDLLPGTAVRGPAFTVVAPTPWPGRERAYLLSLVIPSEALDEVLRREGVPASMTATVSDRRGVVLARSADGKRYVGKSLPAGGWEPTRRGREDWVRTTDITGVPVVLAYARSEIAGWTAAVFMPEAQFEAPLRRSLLASAALGALLVALAAALASVFARRIARPIAALVGIASTGEGNGATELATPVREVNEVGRALAAARRASVLREREREDLLLTLDRAQVLIRDPDGTITVWTSGVEQLYGWTRAEAVGRVWHELLRTEFPRPLPETEAELLARGEWQGELRNRRRDGEEVVVASRWSLRRAPGGEPLAVVESFNDITALRRAEDELRRNRDLLASVLDGSADPIFAKDAEGRYVILNRPAAAVFGSTVEEALGRRTADIPGPVDAAAVEALDREVMETGETRVVENEVLEPDGERRFFLTTKAPWRDAQGRTVGVVGVSREVTLRRRAEAKAQRMQAELTHVSRLSAMGAMATALAHELNQPLTAAANFANAARRMLAGDAALDAGRLEKARQAMAEAADEAVRAGKIVRHLRELVTRGDGEKCLCDINALVEATATLALAGAREQGVAARFDLDPRAPQVLVDRVQIQQVVVNLVRNAVEAVLGAPRREVVVATAMLDAETVEVSVADTGPGLAEEVADRLFEPFVTTKHHGMGVGLSICRTIVEEHGGWLAAEANPGGGTVFRFVLPLPEPIQETDHVG